jgi:hypothetical protein
VLGGDPATRTVRAYERRGLSFAPIVGERRHVRAEGRIYEIAEDALVAPDGSALPRLPGHVAYWFALQSFLPMAATGSALPWQPAARSWPGDRGLRRRSSVLLGAMLVMLFHVASRRRPRGCGTPAASNAMGRYGS